MIALAPTLALLLALGAGAPAGECPPISHPQAVDAVRRLPVSTLQEDMPDQPLGEWLATLAGERTVCWEANDCGEQTGDPEIDRARDVPLCVEAWTVDSDGVSYGLVVMAGTWDRGVHGTPRLRGIYRRDVDGYPPAESLADLARVLAAE